MSIEKLKRVLWKLRSGQPDRKRFRVLELERAIMMVCGTSKATYRENKRALVKLGWIQSHKHHVILTDEGKGEDTMSGYGFERPPQREKPSSSDDEFLERDDKVPECKDHNGEGDNGTCTNCLKF